MFWLRTAVVLLAPMPLTPTVAMFRVSLGAWKPRPSTCRGTMTSPAPAAAAALSELEAIRRRGPGYVAAVQWHPEFHDTEHGTFDDTALLNDFLAAARAMRLGA